MTASELFLMFLVQKLGLTLARLEDVENQFRAATKGEGVDKRSYVQRGTGPQQDIAQASEIPLPEQNLKQE